MPIEITGITVVVDVIIIVVVVVVVVVVVIRILNLPTFSIHPSQNWLKYKKKHSFKIKLADKAILLAWF